MAAVRLDAKTEIERRLRRNPDLHVYGIGDLDDFFWPFTTWYAPPGDDGSEAIILLYQPGDLATLLALSTDYAAISALLRSVVPELPRRFYAHLSPGLESVLAPGYALEPHGEHLKMALRDRVPITRLATERVVRLSTADMDDVLRLFADSYPGNWFVPRMLETDQYFGVREDGKLVSIAGVHVYSAHYRAAALGNITTHPGWRNQGLAKLTTARLCQSLLETVDHIGLNVKSDNQVAISVYRRLGFAVVAPYGEFMLEQKP